MSNLGISKGIKRSKTPTVTSTRVYGNTQKEYSPIRTSYGQYGRDVYQGRPPVGTPTGSMNLMTPAGSHMEGGSIYRNDSSTILKSPVVMEISDNSDKEAALNARLEVLEKEHKNLQALVAKSEAQLAEATRKTQEEENKIFTLFLGVINEKNIKIDLDEIKNDAFGQAGPSETSRKMQVGRENDAEKELHKLLLEQISISAAERSNDVPYTLLALMRRQHVK